MRTNEKARQTFLQHLPIPKRWQVVFQSNHNPSFKC